MSLRILKLGIQYPYISARWILIIVSRNKNWQVIDRYEEHSSIICCTIHHMRYIRIYLKISETTE